MPFQGNGGKGVIDPNIFQMLMKEEQHTQDSQIKMLNAAVKMKAAQAKEARDAAAEQRAIEAHQLELASKGADLFGKQKKLLETTSEQGEAAGVTADSLPKLFAAQQARGLSENTAPENVFTNNANPNFDFSQAPWDPTLIAQDQQETQTAIPIAQEYAAKNPTGTLMDRSYQDIGKAFGQPASEIAQRAALQGIVTQRADEKKTQEEIDKEQRALAKEKALARYRHGLDIAATGDRISKLTDQISAQDDILATAAPGTPQYKRAAILKTRLELGMTKLLSENVDSGIFDQVQSFMDNNVSLMQEAETALQDLYKVKELAQSNPNFLGTTRGGLINFISNLSEGAGDVVGITNAPGAQAFAGITESARSILLRDDTLTNAERAKLGEEMGFGTDGTLQARADAKSLTNRIAFLTTRLQNPGRFSNEQYKINRALYDLTTGSAQQAYRNLLTGIAEMESGTTRIRTRLSVYKGLVPGDMGGLATAEGDTVIPGSSATPFPSLQNVGPKPPAPKEEAPPGFIPPDSINWKVPFAQQDPGTRSQQFLNASPEERSAILDVLMGE